MTKGTSGTPLEKRHICWDCIGESFLKQEVQSIGENKSCHYCKGRKKAILIEALAIKIDKVIQNHYFMAASDPSLFEAAMLREGEMGFWQPNGQPIHYLVADLVEIKKSPASDLCEILDELHYDKERAQGGEAGPFDKTKHYEEIRVEDTELARQWQQIQRSLQQESRLFNQSAKQFFEGIFYDIDALTTHAGEQVVVEAGPNCKLKALYRARVFQSNQALETAMARPDLELGPPPSIMASAGRMNSRGVAVFYGATDKMVALAETRPPVGSSVLVGRFNIERPLKLIDIAALKKLSMNSSYFDPDFLPTIQRYTFLDNLSNQMTRPVMPGDEASDYLMTQAIAEYLANLDFDGIMYPSVQSNGERNVVLFHKSSRVEELDIPMDTEIYAQRYTETEEGREVNYSVTELVPPQQTKPTPKSISGWIDPDHTGTDNNLGGHRDMRGITTVIDIESIWVHKVESVEFKTIEDPVSRSRVHKVKLSDRRY